MDPGSLQAAALAVAQERSVEAVLRQIVDGVASLDGIALARVWLVGPGDVCPDCPMRPKCPDQARCLHLVASAGTPTGPSEDRTRLDGACRRLPLGVHGVGRVGASGVPVLVTDAARERDAFGEPEGTRGFGCLPLVFRGEVLGVLAVFDRAAWDGAVLASLRAFADHAAIALGNGRAFAEVERLRDQLELENTYLREEVREAIPAAGRLVAESAALRQVVQQLDLVAPTAASVLLVGEPGTGKDLVAREIHERSHRRRRALIGVRCTSIPPELLESELFGHVAGDFAGSVCDRAGRLEASNGGTLFLDEVGEIPLALQGKLLLVLEEGRFERVGEDAARSVDLRLVAATSRDLAAQAKAGRFREDLYRRLSAFTIRVPPLRERLADVPVLAAHFVDLAARRYNLPPPRLTHADVERLASYGWPGNVRELQNVIERAVIVSRGGPLRMGALLEPAAAPAPAVVSETDMRGRVRQNLETALRACGGRIYGPRGAAARLGLRPTTLASRLKALGIRRLPQ